MKSATEVMVLFVQLWSQIVIHPVNKFLKIIIFLRMKSKIMQEMWVQSLGWEDPVGKGMATHSSVLAWRIPWTEEPGGLQSTGSQGIRHN